MPKYRVVRTSLIEGRIVQPGAMVDYDGLPGSNLEATDKAGEARKAERAEQRRPKDANEAIGRGMAKGFSEAQAKHKASGADADDTPTLLTAAPGEGLTTVGHSAVAQRSAGGVDAENLLEPDGKGGLVAQNPHSDAKPATKADSPDDGAPKVAHPAKPGKK